MITQNSIWDGRGAPSRDPGLRPGPHSFTRLGSAEESAWLRRPRSHVTNTDSVNILRRARLARSFFLFVCLSRERKSPLLPKQLAAVGKTSEERGEQRRGPAATRGGGRSLPRAGTGRAYRSNCEAETCSVLAVRYECGPLVPVSVPSALQMRAASLQQCLESHTSGRGWGANRHLLMSHPHLRLHPPVLKCMEMDSISFQNGCCTNERKRTRKHLKPPPKGRLGYLQQERRLLSVTVRMYKFNLITF